MDCCGARKTPKPTVSKPVQLVVKVVVYDEAQTKPLSSPTQPKKSITDLLRPK
jgi:hypothetical protein